MPRPLANDLNLLRPANTGRSGYDWDNRRRETTSRSTTAHFGDVATQLITFLEESDAIVGCVAWITSQRILDALDGTPVSLIVNKEWDLRSTDQKPGSVRHRAMLDQLTGGLRRCDFPEPLNAVAGAAGDTIDPVRCVGHITRSRGENTPLMHHKFVVRLTDGKPTAVWTGSFNFTVNSEYGFENAIEIHNPTIAAAYLAEWARVAAVSEPMEFTAGKAEPNWKAPKPKAAATTATSSRPVKRRGHGKDQVASVTERAARGKSAGRRRAKPKPAARRSAGTAKPGGGRKAA